PLARPCQSVSVIRELPVISSARKLLTLSANLRECKRTRRHLPEKHAKRVALEARMNKWCIQIDRIVVTAPIFADIEHSFPPKVPEESPDRAMRHRHGLSDLVRCAIRVRGHVKQHGPMAGNEIKASDCLPPGPHK